mgnify:CR=1 FL=1
MKTIRLTLALSSIGILFFFFFTNVAFSQVTKVADTSKTVKADTLKANQAELMKTDDGKKKDKKGKKNEIILYTGVNLTDLSSSDSYVTEASTGYQLGAYYKQGRTFFWQAGARFANAKIGYKPEGSAEFTDIAVNDISTPLVMVNGKPKYVTALGTTNAWGKYYIIHEPGTQCEAFCQRGSFLHVKSRRQSLRNHQG